MRLTKTSFAALAVALTAVFFMAGCSMTPPNPNASLDKANKLAVEAQNTKGEIAQGEKYKEAVGVYADVVKLKEKSPDAAEAQLALGKIQAGVPIDSTPEQFKPVFKSHTVENFLGVWPREAATQDDYTARDTLRTLVQNFNPQDMGMDDLRASLIREYGVVGGQKILAAIDQAQKYAVPKPNGEVDLLGNRIDTKNRGGWQYKIMDALVRLTAKRRAFSYWFAMVLLAVIVKVLITPLTKMQFKSMKEMQKVQPLVKQITEKYKGDQGEIGRRTMELYKEHGVNPFAGCLPLLVQMPILYAVYGIIRAYEIQFAKGTFLWIGMAPAVHKWSVHLSGNKPVWLTAANLAQPDLILLVLYTGSMILSQRMTVVDPTQADQQKMMAIMMPVMFFFLIGWLPSAFVLYWLMFNVLQTWQQYHILKGGGGPGSTAAVVAAAPEPAAPRNSGSAGRVARRRRRRR